MNAGTPEFSRPVLLARIGSAPHRQEIAASKAERAALARRLDLLSLDRLTAAVELRRQGQDKFLLEAELDAAFVQSCVVTLEPVEGTLAARFALLYGPFEAEKEELGTAEEDPAFEPLTGDVIDIGEAVAQEFSLALPAFPRGPDAMVESGAPPSEPGPFSGLGQFLDRRED